MKNRTKSYRLIFANNKNLYYYTKIPYSADFCNTREQDGDETGVDCGGSCTPCGGKLYCDNACQHCFNVLSFTNSNDFEIIVWFPMLDEVNNMLVCSNADLHVEKELDLVTCKDEARRLDFEFIRHSKLTTDATNGTELNYNITETNMTETNTKKTNTTESYIKDVCQIYRSCHETIPSTEGNTYQYSSKFYIFLTDPQPHEL